MTGATPAETTATEGRWSPDRVRDWYAQQPWIVGCCYNPSYAVNQLEMWQSETFDLGRITEELGWARDLGFNTVRVFLHDLLWTDGSGRFLDRIDAFLGACNANRIRAMPVLFDSCWDPEPHLGPQSPPAQGVCMSRWVQGPGGRALEDPRERDRLEAYVRGVITRFGDDSRVLAWDVWNEPDHLPDHQTGPSYGAREAKDKVQLVAELLPLVFEWVRSAGARQPLTSGVWQGEWADHTTLRPVERVQLDTSDLISFHSYDPPIGFREKIRALRRLGRPLVCTEYLARPKGSTIAGILPVAQSYRVGALNWGFVAGRSQSYLPWDSWERPYPAGLPPVWFHDLLRADGRPYNPAETRFVRHMMDSAGSMGPPPTALAHATGTRRDG